MAKFAERVAFMQETSDVIRYLFESMTNPETISFGGGAPAKEALPVEIVHKIASEVLTRDQRGGQALQYGNPMGIPDLRQAVIDRLLEPKGLKAGLENVIIVGGNFDGNLTVGDGNQSIKDSYNKITSAKIDPELKETLKQLAEAVAIMNKGLPEDQAAEAAEDLGRLVGEATKPKPNKK